MAFEATGAVMLADAVAAATPEIAATMFEAMPLIGESFLASAPELAGTLGSEALIGGESLGSLLGAETAPAALTQSVTPAAQSVIAGGEGAGSGITAATPNAVQTGAVLPEAPSAGINQVASANVPGGTVTDVGVNPDYTAWKNAIDSNQFVPNQELSPDVLKASGNLTPPSTPTPGANSVLNAPNVSPSFTNPGYSGTGLNPLPSTPSPLTPPPSDGEFMQGFNQFVDNHPFLTGAGIYGVASATGMLDQKPQTFGQTSKTPFNNPYHFSSNFQGSHPDPRVYKPSYAGYVGSGYAGGGITQAAPPTPGLMDGGDSGNVNFMGKDMYPMSQQDTAHYATPSQMPTSAQQTMASYEPSTNPLTGEPIAQMASGGIAGYYRGDLATSTGGRGDVYGATQRFLDMYDPASKYTPPADAAHPDVGIFNDTNPSTRDKSALDAATIRQNAIAKKAQVNTGTKYAKPTVTIGQVSVQPQQQDDGSSDQVLAASGGIMGYNLGGYAAGGNPRLLRGPGDGMSDDIPATIGNRQPARLADGEFVVPADVVSGLGNGSTEAGAKKLHQMMDKVRMDRTGKKKQAPAIKAGKYVPK
jgi:hypothetical protein